MRSRSHAAIMRDCNELLLSPSASAYRPTGRHGHAMFLRADGMMTLARQFWAKDEII